MRAARGRAQRRMPVLGELEIAVLDQIWSGDPADAKSVHRTLGGKRRITLNTIQSTLERLCRKGLLAREKVSHAYVYSARLSREQLAARAVEDVVETVLRGDRAPLLAAFVSLAEGLDGDALAHLEQALAARQRSNTRRSA